MWFDRILHELRSDAMIIFFSVSLILIAVMFIFVLDSNFSARKKDILLKSDGPNPILPPQINDLSNATGDVWKVSQKATSNEERLEIIRKNLEEILKKENLFFRIDYYVNPKDLPGKPPKELLIVDDQEKLRRMNTFRNNLLRKEFQAFVHLGKLDDPEYEIKAYYTSPPDHPEITAEVHRYRAYALISVIGIAMVFLTMYHGTFQPMRGPKRPTHALQIPRFIPPLRRPADLESRVFGERFIFTQNATRAPTYFISQIKKHPSRAHPSSFLQNLNALINSSRHVPGAHCDKDTAFTRCFAQSLYKKTSRYRRGQLSLK